MRTTLNLDDDVAAQLRAMSRGARSLSRVANEVLRDGLRMRRSRPRTEAYVAPVFDTGQPLVDVTDVAAALEILETA